MSLYVLRHGETAWSAAHRHTGRSDVPLTRTGRAQARAAEPVLRVVRQPAAPWSLALSSPLVRARDTARLAGLDVEVEDRLAEWDYGEYDGRTTADIQRDRPGWDLWRDGCPGGEQAADVAERVDGVLAERVRPALAGGDVLLVAHSHLLRVLAARWLGLAPSCGRFFVLDPAHLGVLGSEHDRPALIHWNVGAPC
ncbi:MAG TPA: histidine phosphatase family protein [Mycobacteriales bacterium]|nr:histidine phosphatase family protein [Mycobacteriales bacterium]